MQSYTFYVKIYIQNGKKQQVGERMVWLYWFGSYLIGTLITAYFLAKRKGIDLGNEGSGNFGARNIGGVIGRKAFFMTMFGDAFKGALSVLIGYTLELSLFAITIGLLFTVLGHVYPFWNRFKGGKGVATGIGGLLFLTPWGAPLLLVGFLLVMIISRSVTISMLGAFLAYAGYYIYYWSSASIGVFLVMIAVIWAMRSNLLEKIKR